MSSRLRISTKASEQLDYLSSKLDLRRNIVCRLAIGRSLGEETSVGILGPEDGGGYEFNRYTITGEHDQVFGALIRQHEKRKMDDREYVSRFLRNHIERGVRSLYVAYQRTNSPVDFFAGLLGLDGCVSPLRRDVGQLDLGITKEEPQRNS